MEPLILDSVIYQRLQVPGFSNSHVDVAIKPVITQSSRSLSGITEGLFGRFRLSCLTGHIVPAI